MLATRTANNTSILAARPRCQLRQVVHHPHRLLVFTCTCSFLFCCESTNYWLASPASSESTGLLFLQRLCQMAPRCCGYYTHNLFDGKHAIALNGIIAHAAAKAMQQHLPSLVVQELLTESRAHFDTTKLLSDFTALLRLVDSTPR